MKHLFFAAVAASATLLLHHGPAMAQEPDATASYYAENCAACHGRTGRGMASFPSLRGKDADYLADRLTTYRAGDAVGPNSALMIPNAADLDDDQITALAAFMAETFQ